MKLTEIDAQLVATYSQNYIRSTVAVSVGTYYKHWLEWEYDCHFRSIILETTF